MTSTRILRITTTTTAPNDFILVDPNRRDGVVAEVFKDQELAELLASAPNFREALKAILRAECCGEVPTNDDLVIEMRDIARAALEGSGMCSYK